MNEIVISVAIYLLIGLGTIAFEIAYCLFTSSVPLVETIEQYDRDMISIVWKWPFYWICFILDLINPLEK